MAGLELDGEITVEALPGDEGTADRPAEATEAATTGEAGQPGLGWRTRVQFAVRPDGLAGLRAHRSHEVVDIGDCPIAHPAIRDLGLLDYSWEGAGTVEAAAGSPEQDHQDRVVILTKAGRAPRGRRAPGSVPGHRAARDERGRDARVRSEDRAVELFPQDAVDAVEAESVLIRSAHRLTPVRGRQYLTQFAAGRYWQVSAGGFWQVHPAAADTLSEAVVAALEPKPGDTALDLYCGAGLFAGVLAPLVGADGSVTAIESDAAAVRDARANLDVYPWVAVHRNDVALAVADRGLPQARLVVADPPRAGLAREVVDYLTGDSRARAVRLRLLRPRHPRPRPRPADRGRLAGGGPARVRRVPDDPPRGVRGHPHPLTEALGVG